MYMAITNALFVLPMHCLAVMGIIAAPTTCYKILSKKKAILIIIRMALNLF
jgi:hypothetical protein